MRAPTCPWYQNTYFPLKTEIKRINQKARAANGSDIPILGYIQNLKINIDQNSIYVKKILVTSCDLKYLLLGAADILKYPHIVKSIFQNKVPDEGNIKTRSINIRVAELSNPLFESQAIEIQRKFKDIFADEISTSQCCTIKKHKIDTKDHPPICQKEHRVPIHLEDKVQAEIEKLKNLKILQLSESPWRSSLVMVPKYGD